MASESIWRQQLSAIQPLRPGNGVTENIIVKAWLRPKKAEIWPKKRKLAIGES